MLNFTSIMASPLVVINLATTEKFHLEEPIDT